jgi:hypothetical protein
MHTLMAFMNLLKLRERHPFDERIEAAPTVLKLLLRPWRNESLIRTMWQVVWRACGVLEILG